MKKLTRYRFFVACTTLAIAVAGAGTSLAGVEPGAIRLSEPVEQTSDSETFGSPLDEAVPAVSLGEIAGDGDSYVGQAVRVEARVAEVCQKKGCFFVAQEGDNVMRISFKDYAFFVPTDIGGKRVMVVGEVVAKEITAEAAEHFADDLGTDTAPVEPGMSYEIVAVSVRVPRS